MKKFYAVKKGRKQGVYSSWDECKANVEGFANASYKSFKTYEEAKEFVYGRHKEMDDKKIVEEINSDTMIAYIDGSYDDKIKYYSYAAIIFYKGKRHEISERGNSSDIIEMRNVAGELNASMRVMEYAENLGVSKLSIYYDYTGIEKWAIGEWKAKNHFTQRYTQYVNKIMSKIEVEFVKVEAHSGNKYNEEVDKLARNALHKIENYGKEGTKPKDKDNRTNEKNNLLLGKKELMQASKLSNLSVCYFFDNKIISSKELLGVFKKKWKEMKYRQKDIKNLRVCLDVESKTFIFFVELEVEEKIIEIRGEEL